MTEIIKLLISLKKSWHTFHGLFRFSIGLSFLILLSVPVFNSAFPKDTISLKTFTIFTLLVLIIHFVVWLVSGFLRNFVYAKQNRINIALPISSDKKGRKISQQAISDFKKRLLEVDIPGNFNVFDLPASRKFVNDKTAERFIQKEGIDLLVWGYAEQGNIQNIETTVFRLKFSYNFVTLAENKSEFIERYKNFTNDIDKALAGRLWKITRPNTIPDLQVVSENLSEVSLYILIKILISLGYWKLSLNYCDELIKMLTKFVNKKTFPNYEDFRKTVENTSADLSNSISYYYSVSKNNFRMGMAYAKKALTYVDNYFPALINMARVSWYFGDENSARMYTNRAKKVEPSNNLVRINKAFFYLKDKNFDAVIRTYKKIKSIPEGSNIFDVTTFLYSVYEKTEEPAYLFGSGMLNYRFGDPTIGRMELEKFLQLVNDEYPIYKRLIDYSKSIISTKTA